jgi:glycosyltransferase involved in cell wall biosynthesis
VPTPRVTVGMPIFNRAHLLRETIGYVLAQTYGDFELIVFNDGSTDGSLEIARSIADPRLTVIDSENRGPPHPLNEIYARARGEHVIILHDHDIFASTLLEKSVAALDAFPEAGFVLQGGATVSEDGLSNYREHSQDWPALNRGFQRGAEVLLSPGGFSSPFHACSMVRRSALLAVGPSYEPDYGLYADADLWLRLLRRFDFVYLPEVLFRFRERERNGHFMSNREFDILDTMRDIYLKNGAAYFERDKAAMDLFLTRLIRNYCRAERHFALRAAVKRTPNRARGPRRVRENPQQPAWARAVARLAAPSSPAAVSG